jgi:hypothetical protein
VRGGNDLGRRLGIVDRREADIELDPELEAAIFGGQEGHGRVDFHVAGLEPAAPRDDPERAFEARGEADGEQLLRVRASTFAPELGREPQGDGQGPSEVSPRPRARPPVTRALAV